MIRLLALLATVVFGSNLFALNALHRAPCAGLLDENTLYTPPSYERDRSTFEAGWDIGGRQRRVNLLTGHFYASDYEGLGSQRIELPMVEARLPLLSRQLVALAADLLQSNFARRVAGAFRDPVGPAAVSRSERRGVVRYTYEIANPNAVRAEELAGFVNFLGRQGLGATSTEPFEVALGRRVYTGREFFARLAADDFRASERGVAGFIRFFTELNVKQMARNAFEVSKDKRGVRPRYDVLQGSDADLTPEVITRLAHDIAAKAAGRAPGDYDVVVAGRLFTGEEFIELERRMREDGIVSVNAERGFNATVAGVRATAISQVYTWTIRASLVAAVAPVAVTLTLSPLATAAGLTFATLVGVSLPGSAINGYLEAKHPGAIVRAARAVFYLLPNLSGVRDSTRYYAVREHRARVVVDNLASALERHDQENVTIIVNDTVEMDLVRRELTLRYGRPLPPKRAPRPVRTPYAAPGRWDDPVI